MQGYSYEELGYELERLQEELDYVVAQLETVTSSKKRNLLMVDWAELLEQIDFVVSDLQELRKRQITNIEDWYAGDN